MNPNRNLRKIFGLYEYSLNDWLEKVLPRVDVVLDVGANDGYFTFGCVAAFRRQNHSAIILAFESDETHCLQLNASRTEHGKVDGVEVAVHHCLVSHESGDGRQTLDSYWEELAGGEKGAPGAALIKIDVEGAEMDVVAGATKWLRPENFFIIEVHAKEYLPLLQRKFADAGISLEQRDEKPLPLLGFEERDLETCWLVNRLS